jgi:hypothetical protein
MIIDLDESNPHREPCQSCGEETAEGSPLFFDRHTVDAPDGSRSYLCSSCVARSRKKRRSRYETDPEAAIAQNALLSGTNLLR